MQRNYTPTNILARGRVLRTKTAGVVAREYRASISTEAFHALEDLRAEADAEGVPAALLEGFTSWKEDRGNLIYVVADDEQALADYLEEISLSEAYVSVVEH